MALEAIAHPPVEAMSYAVESTDRRRVTDRRSYIACDLPRVCDSSMHGTAT
jgi:hypothetical protein